MTSLWTMLDTWKREARWVDLTHVLSEETPHWYGFPPFGRRAFFDFPEAGFLAHEYTFVGQYGTHVDAPAHFIEGAPGMDLYTPKDMVLPLCVIDLSAACAANPDYTSEISDIEAWEATHGRIPAGAFVAFRSDWSKKGSMEAMENADAEGQKHYPGWSVEALRFLVDERNIAAIGHEPCDTDPALIAANEGFLAETYILSTRRYQIEMLAHLDECPATGALIFCTFPKIKDGTGFPARVFALCPNAE